MSSVPIGYATIGPVIERRIVKDKFSDVCRVEKKTIDAKLKELIRKAVSAAYPDFVFPDDEGGVSNV
jgi:hypothetical protein